MPATLNQEVTNNALGGGATLAVGISNTQAGATLCVYAVCTGTQTLSSVSDTQGNTYTVGTTVNEPTNNLRLTLAYAKNIVGGAGANTVTATFSASTSNSFIMVGELRGVTSNSFDNSGGANQGGGGPGTGANAITTGNVTPTNQPALIYALAMSCGNNNVTAGTGYTSGSSASGILSSAMSYRTEYQRITSTSPIAATATQSTGLRTNIVMAIFDELASSATIPTMMMLGVG